MTPCTFLIKSFCLTLELQNLGILIALDPESEAAVQEALNDLLANRLGMTTIVIAHRLQTIRSADAIFVIKNGTVVEHGPHDQLMQDEAGHYRRMLDKVDSAGHLPE